jgi:hypothetical protein
VEGQPEAGNDRSRAVVAGGDALDRCVAFLSAFAERRATRVVRSGHGLALFDDELPRAGDLNLLWLASTSVASAEELAAETDRLQGGESLAHRKLIVAGLEGERLAADFAALGWQCKSLLVMPQTCAGRSVDTAGVLEVSADELETFWVEGMRQAPWLTRRSSGSLSRRSSDASELRTCGTSLYSSMGSLRARASSSVTSGSLRSRAS